VECERTRVQLPPPPMMMMSFDEDMLVHLVCPLTGGKLVLSDDKEELICRLSNYAYPIREGVPVLRYDKAREIYHIEENQ
jgi:uncharacterized protein